MRKHNTLLLTIVAVLISTAGWSQQLADTAYNPVIENPLYKKGQGPILLLDEAHSNFHTLEGRFSTFARVLEKDGYIVNASLEPFSNEQLGKGKILVVANALNASNLQKWSLPTPSAFTDTEIEAVNEWVKEGGSLFLIADHMPFPGAAERLAASFGFKFFNGFAMKKGGNKAIFSPGNGLIENVITKGRNEKEIVTSVQTFTGQAFEIPKNATPIVVLDSKYELKMPQTAWQFEKDAYNFSG